MDRQICIVAILVAVGVKICYGFANSNMKQHKSKMYFIDFEECVSLLVPLVALSLPSFYIAKLSMDNEWGYLFFSQLAADTDPASECRGSDWPMVIRLGFCAQGGLEPRFPHFQSFTLHIIPNSFSWMHTVQSPYIHI